MLQEKSVSTENVAKRKSKEFLNAAAVLSQKLTEKRFTIQNTEIIYNKSVRGKQTSTYIWKQESIFG